MPCYVWWNYERSIRYADGKCRQFLVILPRASPQISAYCHCFVLNRGVCVRLKIAETSVTSWAVAGKGIATITSIARTSAAKIKEDICRSLFCSHVGGEGNQPRLRKLNWQGNKHLVPSTLLVSVSEGRWEVGQSCELSCPMGDSWRIP